MLWAGKHITVHGAETVCPCCVYGKKLNSAFDINKLARRLFICVALVRVLSGGSVRTRAVHQNIR